MQEEDIFNALDQLPGAIQTINKAIDALNKSNNAATQNVAAISKAVTSLGNSVTSLETKVTELSTTIGTASSKMQKEVSVKVTPGDVNVHMPSYLQEMGNEYRELKTAANNKKEKANITIQASGLLKFYSISVSIVLLIWMILFLISGHKEKNGVEAYAVRAYNSAIQRHQEHPGDFYAYVKEHWNDGEDHGVKKDVEYWERRASRITELENYLTPLCGKSVIVSAYEYKDNEWVVCWHSPEEEPEMVAHIWPNKRVDIADASKVKVSSIQDAQRTSKHKAWTTIQEAQTE